MNIISYSLFEPKKTYQHRFWDLDWNNSKRYWFNVPALLVINSILYPDFRNVFYVDQKTFDSEICNLLVELLNDFDLQIRLVNEEYEGHEPALWRLKPLWQDVDLLLSRDIDSVPNREEYRSYLVFKNSDQTVSTIRSHTNHYNYPCRMLMGLSSFKPNLIPQEIKKHSFPEFKTTYSSGDRWDNDQLTLINCFTTDPEFTESNFLDFNVNLQHFSQDFPCVSYSERYLDDIISSNQEAKLLSMIEEYGLTDWAGQPCDARGDFLNELCEEFGYNKVIDKIRKSKMGEFFL